jgi:hypothetical protein
MPKIRPGGRRDVQDKPVPVTRRSGAPPADLPPDPWSAPGAFQVDFQYPTPEHDPVLVCTVGGTEVGRAILQWAKNRWFWFLPDDGPRGYEAEPADAAMRVLEAWQATQR